MNYPAAELQGIKMNFYLIKPYAEHRGILLIKLGDVASHIIVERLSVHQSVRNLDPEGCKSMLHPLKSDYL